MRFLVLGSTRAEDAAGDAVDLGARKPRSIVAALAMTPGRAVSPELLADLVWGGEPPRVVHGALHSYVSGLRRVLEPQRPTRGAGSVIETTDHGYVLRVDAERVDAHAFAATAARAARALAPLAGQLTGAGPDGSWPSREDVARVLAEVDEALAGWDGEPYADLPDHPDVLAARAALDQQRAAAEEVRLLGLLALGEHPSVLAATEPAVGREQLRERLWALHALALARAGRQADALAALRTVREVLAEELGLDPGAELRGLEEALLRQEPGLLEELPRPAPAPAATPAPTEPPPAGTVGRDAELAALHAALDGVAAGRAAFAQLVGEPGIGKSHLVDQVVAAARVRGHRVGVGRCARDDGAPPLWPWRAALADLGAPDEPVLDGEREESPEQRAFRTAERVASLVLVAAAEQPVLLVLEDLHWADDATLRALTRLVDTAPVEAALTVLTTRRAHPAPTGRLAELSEALARRHALRLGLAGLDPVSARALVGPAVDEAVAAGWAERAGGNPYFLIELARLAGSGGTGTVPASVLDVLDRRLAQLPEPVQERLRTAAVVGARFGLAVVAAADAADVDEVADELDAAVAAGLVVETEPERYAFAHALTQEAVLSSMTGTRAARRHARVARVLEQDPSLSDPQTVVAERARHWLAAGPSHLDPAWRAARAAADQASALTSYPEAMRLRRAAVDAHRRAGAADEVDYELLLELAGEAAYAAQWPEVERAAFDAMRLGRTLGSPERVGRAAAALTRYCCWLPQVIDAYHEDPVDDLRWALAHVGEDVATRARLQLSLAVQLYYVEGTGAERLALATSGVELARAQRDPALVWEVANAAYMVAWRPELLDEREAWVREGLEAARAVGAPRAEAVLLTDLALIRTERGDRAGWEEAAAAAHEIAERERLAYVALTLHWQWLGLAVLREQPALVEEEYATLVGLVDRVAIPSQDMMQPYAWTLARMWDPARVPEAAAVMVDAHDAQGQGGVVVHEVLARAGRVEELRAALAAFPVPEEEETYWSTLTDWSREAEAAAVAGDPLLARRAVNQLAAYRGRIAVAGAVSMTGPVDGALALAHATLGDRATAAECADAADELAAQWELAAYRTWLARHRQRMGF